MASDSITLPDGVTIRPASADDAPAIHNLLADLTRTLGKPEVYQGTADGIRRFGFEGTPRFEALVAEAEGAAVGLVLFFYNLSTWRGRLGIYVQDIHVVRAYRGTGLGRALLTLAARKGRSVGCTHMRLSVYHDNEPAIAFYRGMGLEVLQEEAICQISDDAFDRLAGDGA